MNSALRITATFFNMLPLQKWLHGAGALFLLFALYAAFATKPGTNSPAGGLGAAAALTIMLIPAYMGGFALRHLLSLNTTRLRPHGRERILAGATLTLTALACVATTPTLLARLAVLSGAKDELASPGPTTVFAIAWSCLALAWILAYVVSSSPRLYFIYFMLPAVMPRLLRGTSHLLPAASTDLLIALTCWIAFIVWVLRADAIRTPVFQPRSDPAGMGNSAPAYSLFPYPETSQPVALRQYLLGMPSWWASALIGAGMLLVVAMIALVSMWQAPALNHRDPVDVPVLFVGLFSMVSGATAFMLVRRARMLWLRVGANRLELFGITERHGLMSSLISLGVCAAGLCAWSVAMQPQLLGNILLTALTSLAFSLVLFYAFLGFTRDTNAVDVLLGILTAIALVVNLIATRPDADSIRITLAMLIVWVVIVPLLRWRAMRRWNTLDWRVAKPMVMANSRGR